MKKPVLLICLGLGLLLLPACESRTAKQWQDVFNSQAEKYGQKSGH